MPVAAIKFLGLCKENIGTCSRVVSIDNLFQVLLFFHSLDHKLLFCGRCHRTEGL